MRGSASRWPWCADLEGDPRAEFQRLDGLQALGLAPGRGGRQGRGDRNDSQGDRTGRKTGLPGPRRHPPRIALATSLHRASAILPDEPSRRAAAQRSNEILQIDPAENAELKETELGQPGRDESLQHRP